MKVYWMLFGLGAACVACGDDDDDERASAGPAAGSEGSGQSGNGGASGSAGTNGGGAGTDSGSGGRGGSGGTTGGGGASGSGAGGSGAAAGACMDGTTNHSSGSRVRIRQAVTSEGDSAWLGFHDTTLDVDCRFDLAADGSTRCLPEVARPGVRYYADASCGDALYAVEQACPSDYLLVREPIGTDPCARAGLRVFERGAAYTGSVFQRSGTACNAATAPAGSTLYRLGSERPASEYAAGTPTRWGSGWIATDGIEAEGGLRHARGYRNTMLDEICWFRALADGKELCIQEASASDSFADASCRDTLVYDGATCGEKRLSYLVVSDAASCGRDIELRKVAGLHSGPLYEVSSGACAVNMAPPGADLYTTVPAELSELPDAERVVDSLDPGRLKPSYRSRNDGGCWFDGWYDTVLEERCHFEELADGKSYCFPEARYARFEQVFSDASCRTARTYAGMTACSAESIGKAVMDSEAQSPACVPEQRHRLVGTPQEASALPELYVLGAGGACQRFVPGQTHYVEVGAPVAASELMPGEVSVE
jgi:hypothetical protein